MIIAEYGNNVNATEVFLARQAARQAARREYNPRTQFPHNDAQHAAWLAYWQPFWEEQEIEEQRVAGRQHFLLGLGVETCHTPAMAAGWHEAARDELRGYEYRLFGHRFDECVTEAMRRGYMERVEEEDALFEEKDAKPGLNADDDYLEWMLDEADVECYGGAI